MPLVDVVAFEHALHVVPGLVERDQLDPVDQGVAIAVARIAMQLDPAADPKAALGIQPSKRQRHGAVEALEQRMDVLTAQTRVVVMVGGQPVAIIGQVGLPGDDARGLME